MPKLPMPKLGYLNGYSSSNSEYHKSGEYYHAHGLHENRAQEAVIEVEPTPRTPPMHGSHANHVQENKIFKSQTVDQM